MKQNNFLEIFISAAVALTAVGFLWFTYARTGGAAFADYPLTARLADASGLEAGSDVQIGGLKVGVVSDLVLDGYHVVVHFRVHDGVQIPKDSTVAVGSNGFSPGSKLTIQPGRDQTFLASGAVMAAPPAR